MEVNVLGKEEKKVDETAVSVIENKTLPEEIYGPRQVSSHITKRFSKDLSEKEIKSELEKLDALVQADVARKEARVRKNVAESGRPWALAPRT